MYSVFMNIHVQPVLYNPISSISTLQTSANMVVKSYQRVPLAEESFSATENK